MRKIFLFTALFLFSFQVFADEYKVDGVYPSHWWVGMKNKNLQLLLRGSNIQENNISITYPGVKMVKITKPKNRNYIIIDLVISAAAKPGTMKINLKNPDGQGTIPFQLKARSRENGKTRIMGVNSKDFIYLIMPDRFSNGDPSNDRIAGLKDQSLNRSAIYGTTSCRAYHGTGSVQCRCGYILHPG